MIEQQGQALQQINVGQHAARRDAHRRRHGPVRAERAHLLGKTLLQLDEVGKILDPEFDPDAAIRRNAAAIMTQAVEQGREPGQLLHAHSST